MEHLFLIRASAELSLKSRSVRAEFHRNLKESIKDALSRKHIEFQIQQLHHYQFLRVNNKELTHSILPRIFGIGTFSYIITTVKPEYETLLNEGEKCFSPFVKDKSFAVRCKKAGTYNFKSLDLERELGARLNQVASHVDLTQPEITAHIDFIKDTSYFYINREQGGGGLPTGSQGKALCLLSGGFDSAVAAWRVLRRGVKLDYLLCNIGGKSLERQVLQISHILYKNWSYGYQPKIYVIDFKKVVADIQKNVQGSYNQIILKRVMYKAGALAAKKIKASALVTGEALGQVSSQTLDNLNAINYDTPYIVIRPLIGMDKVEIIKQAEVIGTNKISEKVKELCSISQGCPVTKARVSEVIKQESNVNTDILETALENYKMYNLHELTSKELSDPQLTKDHIPKDVVYIDLQNGRMSEMWKLEGALHYNPEDFTTSYKKLSPHKEYFLYCSHGQQSPLMAELMQEDGFEAYAYSGSLKQLKKLAQIVE